VIFDKQSFIRNVDKLSTECEQKLKMLINNYKVLNLVLYFNHLIVFGY